MSEAELEAVRQAVLDLRDEGLKQIKTRHVTARTDLNAKQVGHYFRYLKDEGLISKWGNEGGRQATWTIEQDSSE